MNWDFLPSEDFPILVYFRETQTPADVREEVPLVVDELDGQVHFFPAISDAQQVRALQFDCHVTRAHSCACSRPACAPPFIARGSSSSSSSRTSVRRREIELRPLAAGMATHWILGVSKSSSA